jgi:alpha-glucosidase
MKRKMMSLLLALAVISGSSVYAKVIDVMSPNGAIKVSVDIKDRIYYSVSYDNDQLLKDCYLNLQLQNETLGEYEQGQCAGLSYLVEAEHTGDGA